MFHQKIDKIFKEMSYVFVIANGILIIGYEANYRDHHRTLR